MKKWDTVQNRNRAKDIELSEKKAKDRAMGKLIDGRIESRTP